MTTGAQLEPGPGETADRGALWGAVLVGLCLCVAQH